MTGAVRRRLAAAEEACRRAARAVAPAAAHESRRRRALWASFALLLVLGPLAFDAGRQPRFHASIEIYPAKAPLLPVVRDPAYYRALLRDPELRRQTAVNAGGASRDWARTTIVRLPVDRGLLVTASSGTPAGARDFVNALGPQLANASGRHAIGTWSAAARSTRARLRGHLAPKARAFGERYLANVERLVAAPATRLVVGPRAHAPRAERWPDRVASAFPGEFPPRPSAVAAAFAGLGVAAAVWLMALAVAPPAGVVRSPAPAAERPGWLGAAIGWLRPPTGAAAARRAPPESRLPRGGAVAAAAVFALAAVVVLWAGRGTTFLGHEWAFVTGRRGGGAHAFLEPLDRHFVPLLVAVYRALFATVGLDHYWPYRLLAAAAHAGCAALVFTYARDRVGWRLAAALTAPIVVFGPASAVLLSMASLGIQSSLMAGIAALLALERKDRRGDVAACGLLLLSLLTWELGVCFALGAAVELLFQRDRRRLWIPLGPLAAYGVWWLLYAADDGLGGPFRPLGALGYAIRMAANAIDSLLALPLGTGTAGHGYHALLEGLGYLLLAAAVALAARRALHLGRLSPRAAALVAIAASYWLFTGATQSAGGDAFAGRYVYPGGVLVLLTVAELAGGVRVPRRPVLIALAAAGALLAFANAGWLVHDGGDRRSDAEVLRSELAAAELTAGHVPPGLRVDPVRAPGVTARQYLAARDDLGSAALAPGELASASPEARRRADALLRRTSVSFTRAGGRGVAARPGTRVAVGGSAAAFVKQKGRCVAVNTPPGRVVVATFALPSTGVVVVPRGKPSDHRPVAVRVRRFARAYAGPAAVLDRSGAATLVQANPDRSPRSWQVAIRAARRVTVC
ncbi:MAG: hypothetical protein ACJ760_06420 [Thermoleophilaceae bacterium]